ncbi:hypothetical protein BDD12DRAFT_873899 [Trichophaea hybrida]|nr:hypothetical protein BDD12DRAFT_873899 [Trichophaea hybrida]
MFARVKTLREWHLDPRRFSKADRYVLSPYFESNEFFDRKWDIYHWEAATNDFFLVPIAQAKAFMDYVAEDTGFSRNVSVPEKQLCFSIEENTIHSPPALIGTVSSKVEYDELVEIHGWKDEDKAVRRKADKAHKAKKRKEKQVLAMMSFVASVRCARQHLGLGNKACPEKEVPGDEVSFDREKPILVAIDVEAWEKDHDCVTEIGIATLDIAKIPHVSKLPKASMADLDLDNIDYENGAPRTRATAICELIECRHLRITEHKSMRNGQFVNDSADKFDFGTSEWVSLKDIPAILGSSLRFYDENGNKRKIILVGHDVAQDFAYLRITGYDVWNIKDVEVMDTTSLYKAINDVHEARGLSTVLMNMGIIFWNLHNAGKSHHFPSAPPKAKQRTTGNDAAYTLQALVHMADRGVPDRNATSSEKNEEEDPPPPVALALEAGQYPDYEDLIEAGCIKYQDPEKHQLGPRPHKEKRGRGKGKAYSAEPPRPPSPPPPIEPGWGWHGPEPDDGW